MAIRIQSNSGVLSVRRVGLISFSARILKYERTTLANKPAQRHTSAPFKHALLTLDSLIDVKIGIVMDMAVAAIVVSRLRKPDIFPSRRFSKSKNRRASSLDWKTTVFAAVDRLTATALLSAVMFPACGGLVMGGIPLG